MRRSAVTRRISGSAPALGSRLAPDTLRSPVWLCGVLLVAIAATYLPVLQNGFVNWDDEKNFLQNNALSQWGWKGFQWAWTTFHMGVYQPLAWLAFLVEHRLWGLSSCGYHLTSLLVYCVALWSSYRLFLTLLEQANPPGERGELLLPVSSLLALTLFAVHPLRVENVAWASGQPYLFCLLFCTAATRAYLRAHSEGINQGQRRRRLGACFALFCAALLSKPAAIGFPAALIALDFYPLRRLGWQKGPGAWKESLTEKIPLLPVVVLFGWLAMAAKREGRALESWHADGFGSRIAQAGYSACFYVAKTLWPAGLTHFYGRPSTLSVLDAKYALCVAAVVVVTAGLFLLRRRLPAPFAAWLLYLVILSPALGAIRFGPQIVADRFALLSTLPLFALLAGAGPMLFRTLGRWARLGAIALWGCAIGLLIAVTRSQAAVWRNSEALWAHSLAVQATPEAHTNLATFLDMEQRSEEALEHFRRAAALDPRDEATLHNLGKAFLRRGRLEEAAQSFTQLVALQPRSADYRVDLGAILARLNRSGEAEAQYLEALRLDPAHPVAHLNLGIIFFARGEVEQAKEHFSKAAQSNLADPAALIYLGAIEWQAGRLADAERYYAAALKRQPDSAEAAAQLGALLVRAGRVLEGTAHLRAALSANRLHPLANFTLGQLMANNGRTAEARQHFERALQGHPDEAQALEIRRALDLLGPSQR
jgi:protein O-mannosyl-transferase